MSVFGDAGHAVSWAGLCPGNRESAGKRLSSRTRKGNRWIRRALCQSAWAVTRKRNCHLTALFYRLTARLGLKKAIVVVAHQILVTAFCVLRDQSEYHELGGNFFDQQHPHRTQNRLVRRLERLGLQVVISPAQPVSEPAPSHGRRGRPYKCLERGTDCKRGYKSTFSKETVVGLCMRRRKFAVLLPMVALLVDCEDAKQPTAEAAWPLSAVMPGNRPQVRKALQELQFAMSGVGMGGCPDSAGATIPMAVQGVERAVENLKGALGASAKTAGQRNRSRSSLATKNA